MLDAIYGENYYKILKGEKLEYKDINFIPYYLYKGLNLQNAKSLVNNKLDTNFLKLSIIRHTVNPVMKNGKRYFTVTTSLDYLESYKPEEHLYEEGILYKIPKANVKYFEDTASGERYLPGETIEVQCSTHLKTIN